MSLLLFLVAKLSPILCNPMGGNMPSFPIFHHLPEFAQTHVHWVSDAIQPSHPLSPPSPLVFNLSQHQAPFQWVDSLHQVAKGLELQLQHLYIYTVLYMVYIRRLTGIVKRGLWILWEQLISIANLSWVEWENQRSNTMCMMYLANQVSLAMLFLIHTDIMSCNVLDN